MAGSQLKQLKATLKANGLTGQTNIKTKKQKSKGKQSGPSREDREKLIKGIRSDFNQFDQRINRTKHDVTTVQGGRLVRVGSKQHNNSARTKSQIQNAMRADYNMERRKHKVGGLVDRRFGERNKDLSSEERMLERFTRERQAGSKKSVFSLESDEEDNDGGFTLTHAGKTLSLSDEDEGLGDGEIGYKDEENQATSGRKKSKREVMKEIIARSKLHKHQRQVQFQKTQDEIGNLDDDFNDLMDEMLQNPPSAPLFSSKTPEQIEYDTKVKELAYDKRSVPSDRTKTEEEISKERTEKRKKLEDEREGRMNGNDDREAEGDDLDDFWVGDEEGTEDGFTIRQETADTLSESENSDGSAEDERVESSEEKEDEPKSADSPHSFRQRAGSKKSKLDSTLSSSIPSTHDNLLKSLSNIDNSQHLEYISNIVEKHKPHLAEGNKEKMDTFVKILFEHILYLSGFDEPEVELLDSLVKKEKSLAQEYNEALVAGTRSTIDVIQQRIVDHNVFQKQDLVFFSIVGFLFSTSDHYHLVVTPSIILMSEFLSILTVTDKLTSLQIGQGIFLTDLILTYQRHSKRYVPEIVSFLERALLAFIPEPEKISDKLLPVKSEKLEMNLPKNNNFNIDSHMKFSELFLSHDDTITRTKMVLKIISAVDNLTSLWREKSALIEVIDPFLVLFKHLMRYTTVAGELLKKLDKIQGNLRSLRRPLTLQSHRALSIPTFAPKFEENFNPDKKSYDVNLERQELNKMKHELKKQKKAALKDIRSHTKFVAREQIKEKKKMYDDYHGKMARIVNSISTVEGAERNQYEKERKQRKQGR